jgi:hypothetical protein
VRHLAALAASASAAIALALALPAAAGTTTLFVAPGGDDGARCTREAPCGSFARAYELAAAGDTVDVAPGVYGPQTLPAGDKSVTFRGRPGNTVRQIANHARDVTFDGLNADAGATKLVAFFNDGASGVVFEHGSIGNVVDEKGALVGGADLVFDDVLFHDVVERSPGVHNECLFISNPERLVLRNSTFRGCATMDVNMNWLGYLSPPPPAYGHVTIENNVFGHSTNGTAWHYYGFVLGGTGPNAGAPKCAQGEKAAVDLHGWRVVNNTFENAVIVGDGANGCGDGHSVWANNIGSGWACLRGVTYRGNVGQRCDPSDRALPRVSGARFADAARDDFRLAAGSPAIGAADPAYAPPTDQTGVRRDRRPDAGAYEHRATAAVRGGGENAATPPTSGGLGATAVAIVAAAGAALGVALLVGRRARRLRLRARR